MFPGLVDTLMPTQFLQQQISSPFPQPSPGVQNALRNAFWYAYANTMQTQQQYQQQLQLLNVTPAPKKRGRKRKKKAKAKTLSKKIMPVRSKSFRDVRPYHLGTRARILFSCLYHWFWGVDQLNPFIDTEIIFQKMMVIPRTWCSSAKRENFNLMPQILRLSLTRITAHSRVTNIVCIIHKYR